MDKKNTRREFLKTTGILAAGTLTLSAFGKNPIEASGLLHNVEFKLEPLPYGYADLEPYIDAQTMEIHYAKHHQAYVDNLNKAIKENNLGHFSIEGSFAMMEKFPAAVRNNAGGHYNHSLFWKMMAPKGVETLSVNSDSPETTGQPGEKLMASITKSFGSMEAFKEKFSAAAKGHFGSGWAWLVVNAKKELEIGTTPNQDNPLMSVSAFKGKPVLALDVWEHAYYLKHQNKRADYITAWWNVVNWSYVDQLYALAVM
ncbi:MAG: superoxide dismutase [Bacteroidota bacterium]